MLALTHHAIVQLSAFRVGHRTWFNDYALLGDDIVIADKAVADAYLYIMVDTLGVEINLSKSLVSTVGCLEFAKRLVDPYFEFTPLGAKNIYAAMKSPAMFSSLFLDYLGKGGTLTGEAVETLILKDFIPTLSARSNRAKSRKMRQSIELFWMIAGPLGIVPTERGLAAGFNPSSNSLNSVDISNLLTSLLHTQLVFEVEK
jgi:hypothetical protein